MSLPRIYARLLVLLCLPAGIAAQSLTATLQWDPSPSSNVTGYHVYRRTGSTGSYSRLTVQPVTLRSFVDSTAAYGQLYSYTATAVNGSGSESLFSEAVTLDLICRGDVNTDRQRNVLDVVQIQNHIVGTIILQNNALIAGDVDRDGQISVLDAVRLLNHVAGVVSLPACVM